MRNNPIGRRWPNAMTAACYYIIHGPKKGALAQTIEKALASLLEPDDGKNERR
jgi:hypothetical protein